MTFWNVFSSLSHISPHGCLAWIFCIESLPLPPLVSVHSFLVLGFLKAVFQTCPVGGKYILIAVLDSLVGSFLPIQTKGVSLSVGLICPAVGWCSWPIVINLCSLDLGAALQGLGQTDLWTTSAASLSGLRRPTPSAHPTGDAWPPQVEEEVLLVSTHRNAMNQGAYTHQHHQPNRAKDQHLCTVGYRHTKMVAGKAKEGQVWTIGKLGLKDQAKGAIGSWIFSLVWNFTPTKS